MLHNLFLTQLFLKRIFNRLISFLKLGELVLGLRERLAKANWELNYFFRTGRFPKYDAYTTVTAAPTQFNGSQWLNAKGNHLTLCASCKNYVPKNANYCDKCGKKLR